MMMAWSTMLSQRRPNGGDVYGGYTDDLCSAMDALSEAKWFEQVGESVGQEVERVANWDQALAILDDIDDLRYGPNGHLLEPARRCWEIINSAEHADVWKRARTDVTEYVVYGAYIPETLPEKRRDRLELYLYEFLSFLLAEIIAGGEMTYFREQLQWFHAGHLPCGWTGQWPEGRMCVF